MSTQRIFDNIVNQFNSDEEEENEENESLNHSEEKRKHTKRPSPPFYYGKHYFKKNNRIYVYVPKAKTVSLKRNTLYCIYRGSKDKCMAKIIVHQKDNRITYIGSHICHPKMTIEDFNKKFPNIEKSNWTHIQFAVRNGKPYILSQY